MPSRSPDGNGFVGRVQDVGGGVPTTHACAGLRRRRSLLRVWEDPAARIRCRHSLEDRTAGCRLIVCAGSGSIAPRMAEEHKGVIRVMVVEDDGGTRDALTGLLRQAPGFLCTGAHRSARSALERLASEKPQVVLVDLNLPGMSGTEFIRACRQSHPATELLVLTIHDEPMHVFPALSAGASGYLVKGLPLEKILEAIREVADGGASMSGQVARMVLKALRPLPPKADTLSALSEREAEVLRLLAEGLRYDEIASRLSLSPRTVNSHLQRVYRKLHVHSATAAVARLNDGRRLA